MTHRHVYHLKYDYHERTSLHDLCALALNPAGNRNKEQEYDELVLALSATDEFLRQLVSCPLSLLSCGAVQQK